MIEFNFKIIALAGLVPLVMGFLWYGPLLFKNAWMKEMGFTEESLKGGNMALIFILSYVFSLFIGLALDQIVIHQFGLQSTLMKSGETALTGVDLTYFQDFMATYGDRFRTFKHGALHGAMTGLFLAMPIMATNAMFERKSFKYVAINVGYWTVTLAIMGGILCQYN